MAKEKKPFILKQFTPYMGGKRVLLPLSLILSALSAVLNLLPFVFIWYVARSILAEGGAMELAKATQYALWAFLSAIGGLVLYFFALMSSHIAAFRVEVGMQKKGMAAIMSMPLGFFDKHASGKMRKIVNDGAGTTHTFLAHQLPDMAGSLISPIILLILIAIVDWKMGLVSMIPIVLGFISMSFMMSAKGQTFQKQYFDSLEEMSAESVEYVRGIPVVKTFGQTIFSFKRFYGSIMRYKELVHAYTLLWQKSMSFYTAMMQSAAFFLVPMSIFLIDSGGDIGVTLTNFIFYLAISPLFTLLFMKSMYFRQNVQIASQAIDRLDQLLDYPALPSAHAEQPLSHYGIEFKNVSFAYDGAAQNAVDNLSFSVEGGETVALVGASGGGKTTIARLAARFWDADSGDITIGGVSVKAIPKDQLMAHVAFVFQNTRLFKGTLRDNILFGNPNATEAELDRAIDLSQSRDIIDALPNGLETVMGSKGTYLSGGEQQRIALARAIIKDAPIVLLDEATAFADPENEHLIQKALKALSHGKTTLMIAHRLTSVRTADKILVIENGRIAESGTHATLLERNGLYKRMWDEYQRSVEWKISGEAHKGGQYDSAFSN